MPSKVLRMPAPNLKQQQALRAQERYVAYGGARGGGKSWFVRWKAVLLCLRYAGIKVLITRKTYRELMNNHIVPLREILHDMARYNSTDKMFAFPNGSSITFGYCANEGDLGQYQGAEFDVWFADEAGQFMEDWLTKIDACVRGVNGFPKRTYYTLNPGGPSHGYFKRLFVDRRYEADEHPEDYTFIQALCTDNKALMASQPEYMRSMEKLPPKIREAWLYGRWDIYEGQFFDDFRAEPDAAKCLEAEVSLEDAARDGRWTHVIEPFDLSKGSKRAWEIYRSYDFGYAKPFSCAWYAIDFDGTIYRFMELYGCTGTPDEGMRWSPQKQFEEIARIEREHPWLKGRKILGLADPAIWDRSHGDSIADIAVQHGVYFSPGDHQRLPGWMQCHYRLQFDENGYARFYVFNTCKDFIRTIPKLMHDEHRPEDLDTKGEDHIADEWRYLCQAHKIEPVREVEQRSVLSDPLNQFGGSQWKK